MRVIMQRKRRRNKGERESDLVLPVFTNYIEKNWFILAKKSKLRQKKNRSTSSLTTYREGKDRKSGLIITNEM